MGITALMEKEIERKLRQRVIMYGVWSRFGGHLSGLSAAKEQHESSVPGEEDIEREMKNNRRARIYLGIHSEI